MLPRESNLLAAGNYQTISGAATLRGRELVVVTLLQDFAASGIRAMNPTWRPTSFHSEPSSRHAFM
jgi:hypothetical protein